MRGSKVMSTQSIPMNDDGTQMSEEQLTHRRKYLNFASDTFPEINPIEMLLPEHKGNG